VRRRKNVQFELTETQRDIQKAAKEFAEKEFDPDLALNLDREGKFPKTIFEKACKLGFVGIDYPEEYGGQSLGLFESVLVIEEFCRKDSGIGISISLADMGSSLILRHGDEKQKKDFVAPVTQGKATNAVAVTDCFNFKTRAEREGSDYVVNGKKSFVPDGPLESVIVTFCETPSGPDSQASGRAMLIVKRDQKGLTLSERKRMMGIRMSSFHEVFFDHVRVSRDLLVGEEGMAGEYLTSFLTEQRIKTAAQALGIAQGTFEQAVRHAREREQFGRKIGQFQGIQFMLSEMLTQIEAGRSLVYRAALNWDGGSPDREKLSSMARLFAADAAVRTALDSIQIHGGVGLMKEYPVERMFRDAKTIQNLGETGLVQRALIGKSIIA
jgi:alkylation response protein AidB-like acyl-CoA dehydrogenase